MSNDATIPASEWAVQLTGPSQLTLNTDKPVPQPGPTQILAKVEATGLCFSDLKLLKQFSAHPRKSEVVAGITPDALAEVPSYVPGEAPTVPGHEAVIRIIAVGDKVTKHKVGERVMVQADWREARTAESNGAFGYNFEGALQEYVLLDERLVVEPSTGERYLIPADAKLCASAVALVEPWACVENSYVTTERNTLKAGGKLLVVAEAGCPVDGLREAFSPAGAPVSITALVTEDAQKQALEALGVPCEMVSDAASLPNEAFDDIVYFGAGKAGIDALNDKLAARGIFNIVLCGRTIGQPISVGVGRVHYGLTRWVGTTGSFAAEAYGVIPPTGEVRDGDRVLIVGAGGPMGQMHTLRVVCADAEGLTVVGTDFDDERLESLKAKVAPAAEQRGVSVRMVNTKNETLNGTFTYFALMAPVAELVAQAIRDSAEGAIINIFAGIPAPTRHELDMDRYIANRCFMFGTSGSRIEDMKIVLDKVTSGQLDTNASVDAVSGMAGAIDGIAAVENRTMAGKIIVYPELHDLPLTPLDELAKSYPTVAGKLEHGMWTQAAEEELLRVAK